MNETVTASVQSAFLEMPFPVSSIPLLPLDWLNYFHSYPTLHYAASWEVVNFEAAEMMDHAVPEEGEDHNRETVLVVTSTVHFDRRAVGHSGRNLLLVVVVDSRTVNHAVAAARSAANLGNSLEVVVVDLQDTVVGVAVVHYCPKDSVVMADYCPKDSVVTAAKHAVVVDHQETVVVDMVEETNGKDMVAHIHQNVEMVNSLETFDDDEVVTLQQRNPS